MSDTWRHSHLGVFEHHDIWWRREIELPALQSFTYIDVIVRKCNANPEPFELVLQCETEDEEPHEQMASLAAAILGNISGLISKALEAIWLDVNGQDPDSGMWWH